MTFDLPALARRKGIRRNVTLRPIEPTQAHATELAAIMVQAAALWRERIDLILAGYDPQPLPTGDTLTRDDAGQMTAAIDGVAAEFMTRLAVIITPALRRFAVGVEQWHRSKWIAAVRAGTGIDLSSVLTSLPTAETVEAFVSRNVALVRNISDQAQARIADAVWRGYQARTPMREVARELREAVDLGRDRARRVAADQSAKLVAALDDERRAEAGVTQYRWRHSGKLHYRPEHKARDGKVYKNGEPKGDTPGMAPFCGCRAQAYLPVMDEIE